MMETCLQVVIRIRAALEESSGILMVSACIYPGSPGSNSLKEGCTSSAATVPQVNACAGAQPSLRARDQQSVVLSGEGDQTAFTFDHVAGADTSQQQFYRGA